MSLTRISALLLCIAFTSSAQDAATLARKAMSLQQAGDYAAAAQNYATLLKIIPNDVPTHVNYGVVLVHLDRYQEAINQYELAEKQLPGDPRIELNLALAYQKSGKQAEALQRFESLHTRDPQNPQVSLLLADSYLQAGNYPQILTVLDPLKDSTDLGVAYLMATALLRTQKPAAAKIYLDRVVGNGDTPEAHYLLGIQASESGDFPSAAKELAASAEKGTDLPGLQSLLGHALLNTGDPDAALQSFDKALKQNANDAGALREKSEILIARKQFAAAEPLIRRAALLLPNDLETSLALAEVLLHDKKLADARHYAEQAVKAEPADLHAHRLLAQIYRQQGIVKKAASEDAAADKLAAALDPGPPLGEPAPDFQLPEVAIGRLIHLADYRGKSPVALVFGSYSCPNFRESADALKQLQKRYADRVPFFLVYVKEAHAAGQWQSGRNTRADVTLPAATNFADKQQHAAMCARTLHLPFPALVDGMDGAIESAYNAWPSRLFLIDKAGNIALSTRLTELDFQPDRVQALLETLTVK